MSVLRQLRLLVFGETWVLPAGVAIVLAVCALLHEIAAGFWHHAGGFVLLAGVITVLSVALAPARSP